MRGDNGIWGSVVIRDSAQKLLSKFCRTRSLTTRQPKLVKQPTAIRPATLKENRTCGAMPPSASLNLCPCLLPVRPSVYEQLAATAHGKLGPARKKGSTRDLFRAEHACRPRTPTAVAPRGGVRACVRPHPPVPACRRGILLARWMMPRAECGVAFSVCGDGGKTRENPRRGDPLLGSRAK